MFNNKPWKLGVEFFGVYFPIKISLNPLTTTLVALESIPSDYEGWIDFDITNSALKWVGTME